MCTDIWNLITAPWSHTWTFVTIGTTIFIVKNRYKIRFRARITFHSSSKDTEFKHNPKMLHLHFRWIQRFGGNLPFYTQVQNKETPFKSGLTLRACIPLPSAFRMRAGLTPLRHMLHTQTALPTLLPGMTSVCVCSCMHACVCAC